MKQFRILAALILSMIGGSAMAQQYMIVNLEDGRKVEYMLSEVKEVTFREGISVDLGLPSGTLWATCNVGASEPQQYGDYFSWAVTTPWVWEDYHKEIQNRSKMLAYGIIDETNHVTSAYDAATANWGEEWRLPTVEQWQELIENCTWEMTTLEGINGMLGTAKNNATIFFPLAGIKYFNYPNGNPGATGYYWTSNYYYGEYEAWHGKYCDIASYHGNYFGYSFGDGGYGLSVRAVRTTPKETK